MLGGVALSAFRGAQRGLVATLLGLAGFAVGAIIGSRIAPLLLQGGRHSPWLGVAGLIGALVGGSIVQVGAGAAAHALPRARAPRPVGGRGHRRRRRGGPGARPCNRLARRGRRARAAQPSAAPQRPALDDPARTAPRRARRAASSTRWRASTRCPWSRRSPTGRSTPPDPAVPRAPRPARREGERRACPGHGLRARHPGVGLGGQARDRRHERPRDRGRARHRGAAADGRHVSRRSRSPSTPGTTSRSCACHGLPLARLTMSPKDPSGGAVALIGYPQNGPLTSVPGPGRRAGDRARPRGLRRQRAAAHGRAAPRPARARRQRRAGGRPPRPGRRDDVRGRPRGRRRLRRAARGDPRAPWRRPDSRVSSGPCIG